MSRLVGAFTADSTAAVMACAVQGAADVEVAGAVVVVGGTVVVVVVVAGGAVVVVVGAEVGSEVGTEVDVRSPVNEMGQPPRPPDASRLSWPVPVMSLPPLLSVIVKSLLISFAGSKRTR